MFIITDKKLLKDYTKLLDKDENIKNFRLYYQGRATNLVWNDGKISYLPEEYFALKNLVNVDMKKKYRCSIFLYEVNLIKELKKLNIKFLLEDNLAELIKRLEMSGGLGLNDDVAIELIDDNDYSKFYEPIYLGNGVWINIE